MSLGLMVEIVEWMCLAYFAALNLGYLALNGVSFIVLSRYLHRHVLDATPQACSDFEPPVSLLVPAYNEQSTVVATVRSLLQLNYSHFEIVVINDGSTDGTLNALRSAFDLEPFPEVVRVRLRTAKVRGIYHSTTHPELRVIDKENGGKADALNAGINAAMYPLFCALDADGVLQPDSLRRVVRPFIEDALTVAAGGIIRIANGCQVVGGWLVRAGLPGNLLALFQVVEYCRAFLFGRLGWNPLNGVLCISGAFGVFRKETVISVGGYRTNTVGEDMELVLRLHRMLRHARKPYRVVFVPDPVCWTEAPENIRVLRNQRIRWQRGLCESLSLNIGLMFGRHAGIAGWVAFPFALLFECLSPVIELFGYAFFAVGYPTGLISLDFALAFLVVAVGFGMLLSVSSLLLDEMSYHTYPKARHLGVLLLAAACENFGYRQLNTFWRFQGILRWAIGTKQGWGEMKRSGAWSAELPASGQTSPQQ
jgi:cellulose synthase/poly-beta-1,6-N-acetylglucosamine synthase-like glycosyltransferase